MSKRISKRDVDRLVAEITALEPELEGRERQLAEAVRRVLEARPEVLVDRTFVDRLRRELVGVESRAESPGLNSIVNYMKNMRLIVGGSAVVAALALVAVLTAVPEKSVPSRIAYDDSGSLGIGFSGGSTLSLGPNAFGSLGLSAGPVGQAEMDRAVSSVAAPGFGGGGGVRLESKEAAPIAIGMPGPEYGPATVRYVAGQLPDFGEQVEVFRRVGGLDAAASGRTLASLGGDLLNLSGLSGLSARSASLTFEDGQNSYWVHLDMNQGSASLNLEYNEPQCFGQGCPGGSVGPVEVDAGRVVALADSFLDRFGVDRSAYGEPAVDTGYEGIAVEGGRLSLPEYVQHVTVVYQLMPGGNPAHGWDGNPYGPRVTVDVSRMVVQGAHSIVLPRFESSGYAAEIDAARLVELAENGGMGGSFWLPKGSPEVEIGTPEVMYYQYSFYDREAGQSSELYLPALFFPIVNADEFESLHRSYVIVPLVKEVLDQQGGKDVIGRPMPEPMPAVLRAEPDIAPLPPAVEE